MARTTSVMPSG
jgi:serine palmitoyltransferase